MTWLNKNIASMIKLPRFLFVMHIFCKFLFGLGIGILLVSYTKIDWKIFGWILIIAAFILDIPSIYLILTRNKGKTNVSK